MTLGFKQYFPWHTEKNPAPTNFREKILFGAGYITDVQKTFHGIERKIVKETDIDAIEIHKKMGAIGKIHTMREDPHNRWKAGRKIEMVYRGAGYKILDHFNKGIPELGEMKEKQKVEIKWVPFIGAGGSFKTIDITIDGGRSLTTDQIMVLAANDGFDSIDDFFRWFNKDWSGYILHWTDFRY